MAFTPARNVAERNPRGGGVVKAHEVLATAAELGSADGYWELGTIEGTNFTDETAINPELDETGQEYNATLDSRNVVLTGTIAERGENIMKIAKETRGKYYLLMHDEGEVNGKQSRVFMFGKFSPKTSLALSSSGNDSGKIEFEFRGIKTPSAITLTLANLTATGTAGWATNCTATITIAASNSSGSTGIYERNYTTN